MTNLVEGDVKSRLFRFMLPLSVGNILQQCYSFVDGVIVGQVVGKDGLAAIGASNSIQFLMIAILMGLGAGAEILISMRIGQQNMRLAKRTLDTLLTSVLALSLVLTVIGVVISESVLRLIGTPDEILSQAVQYLQIYFIGLIGVAGYSTLSGMIRSTGNSKVPLILLIITSIVNVVLDLVFVAGWHMGVAGAGIATVIAQTLSFILCLIYINKKKGMLKYHPFHQDFDWGTLVAGLKCGIPYSIEQGAISIGMIFLQAAVNSLGVNAMTAYTIGSRIDSFANIPITGMGQALCIFTSQNLGAKKLKRTKKGKNLCLFWAYCFSAGLLIILWIAGKSIIRIFTDDLVIIDMTYDYIRTLSVAYFLASYFVILNGYIRGTGNTVLPMASSLAGYWIARLPAAYLLKGVMGYMGVWLAVPAGWVGSCIITCIYAHSKKFAGLMKKHEQAEKEEDEYEKHRAVHRERD
ncbi:MATE family efflux transporter [Sellimonas caecigallum]|uniref:Probable multidrug resistance protein NorM n=1 Tax=Sellimonas caecigallum TaxID=2592333 RepID=A0ABS7L843_9FIRM|nr:MATE family efflux transporter [Sellimonas caecigallum]MBY0759123.1 MATE family efflux transporter [Sellimonas caecigallum]